MTKQELIDYCTCRDFDYTNLMCISVLTKCDDIPSKQEYCQAVIDFNKDMSEYFSKYNAKHWHEVPDDTWE